MDYNPTELTRIHREAATRAHAARDALVTACWAAAGRWLHTLLRGRRSSIHHPSVEV